MSSKKLNQAFDKVYVLTLKRSQDRHLNLDERLAGVNYELFFGVDGKKLNKNDLKKNGIYDDDKTIKEKKFGNGLKINEVACSLSHLSIYKDMLENGYKRIVILEDDVQLKKENLKFFEKALSELPPSWEVLYLGYFKNNEQMTLKNNLKIRLLYPFLNLFGCEFDANKLKNHYPKHYSTKLERAGFHYGAFGYAITDVAAKKIIEENTPVIHEADIIIPIMIVDKKLDAYRLKFEIIEHAFNFKSTIRESEVGRKQYLH